LGSRISFERREDRQENHRRGNCGDREVWRERMIKRERMINNVVISAFRIWIWWTTISVRIEMTKQFLPDNGDWLR